MIRKLLLFTTVLSMPLVAFAVISGHGSQLGFLAADVSTPAAKAPPVIPPSAPAPLIPKSDADWKVLKVGAGGYVTGIDIAPDGTKVARTDTYGGYVWEKDSWRQLFTRASMPSEVQYLGGAYEIRVAPSAPNVLYGMINNGLYKSIDRGRKWIRTAFPETPLNANAERRMNGQKLAVDPSNPDVVFAGTQSNGLWSTRDGGATWQRFDAVPQGSDPKDASLTGITIKGNTIYVGVPGSGVHASFDGGNSWKGIGGPTVVFNAALGAEGSYLAAGTGGALWEYSGGSWTKAIGSEVHGVAVDPLVNGRVVAVRPSGNLQISTDGGATWPGGWNWKPQLKSAEDIPWLEKSESYMSSGVSVFDPQQPGLLWQSAGVGVWSTKVPSKLGWNVPVIWQSQSKGIEQLVANDIVAPSRGLPTLASWDRALFSVSNPEAFATAYSPPDFMMGWSVDYASSEPLFQVALVNWWGKEQSGYSADGGLTWQKFASVPASAVKSVGGSIAASTPQNIVWVPSGDRQPAFTLDGGKSWQPVNLPGHSEYKGLHSAYYLARRSVTADRVLPNTFYLYESSPKTPGLYRSSDGGRNWQKVFSRQITDWSFWNAQLQSVPGQAGTLLFTAGPQGSKPDAIDLKISRDGGRSWSAIPGARAFTFGFGAATRVGGPATIYMWGFVRGVRAVWGSEDMGATWVKLGTNPLGSLDTIKVISGDMSRPGRVYIGFGGSGYAYLDR